VERHSFEFARVRRLKFTHVLHVYPFWFFFFIAYAHHSPQMALEEELTHEKYFFCIKVNYERGQMSKSATSDGKGSKWMVDDQAEEGEPEQDPPSEQEGDHAGDDVDRSSGNDDDSSSSRSVSSGDESDGSGDSVQMNMIHDARRNVYTSYSEDMHSAKSQLNQLFSKTIALISGIRSRVFNQQKFSMHEPSSSSTQQQAETTNKQPSTEAMDSAITLLHQHAIDIASVFAQQEQFCSAFLLNNIAMLENMEAHDETANEYQSLPALANAESAASSFSVNLHPILQSTSDTIGISIGVLRTFIQQMEEIYKACKYFDEELKKLNPPNPPPSSSSSSSRSSSRRRQDSF
jgi:hypothetical protein